MLQRTFKLDEHGTTVRREIIGGVTTFLTMAYILFVNPTVLGEAGMNQPALITVTALAACFGTALVGLWANVPFAMAPGMGLNAFFTYTIVLRQGIPWQTALGVVFLSGLAFLLLTVAGIREKIVNAIPVSLRLAVSAGIGLFICFIGLQNLGLVVDHPVTMVTSGPLNKPVIFGLIGLVVTIVLDLRRVPGAILVGVLISTLLGWTNGLITAPESWFSVPPSVAPLALKIDILGALKWTMIAPIFSFMFVDLFDSIGTVVACSYEADLVREDGTIPRLQRMLEADAIATAVGALLGTSTTTTYIESGSGIAAGARTGLASLVTALLFLAALVLTPIIGMVPKFATAPALIIVGIHMFRNVRKIDFSTLEAAVPAFLVIALMPMCYSISTGLTFGFLAYIIIAIAAGHIRRIHPIMWGIGALSLLDLILALITR